MSDAPPLLAARGLRFARNEQPVFGPLAFSVDAGEALLVQGDNGAGKTTLLRVLAGLLRPDEGEIDIDGRPASPLLRARAIAYLGHLPALKADLTAMENLLILQVSREPLEAHHLQGLSELATAAYHRACYLIPSLARR